MNYSISVTVVSMAVIVALSTIEYTGAGEAAHRAIPRTPAACGDGWQPGFEREALGEDIGSGWIPTKVRRYSGRRVNGGERVK